MKHSISILLAICFVILFSCADTEIEIFQKEVKDADKIKIYFYDSTTGKIGSPDRIFTIENKEEIEKYKDLFTDEEVPQNKCGYTGLLEFFSKGKTIISTEFNLNPECRHIVLTLRGRAFSKKLSNEGLNLLKIKFNSIKQ
ncbi:MAG: hypothetical protein JW917_04880 [Ignavibacteria bacterium]|nr:hypothetical protein [Ignavibacteria bacterium]